MPKRTTARQFKLFVKWCKHYHKLLGLNDWQVYYTHADAKNGIEKDSWAATSGHFDRHDATIFFNRYPDVIPNNQEIRDCALHEMLHVFLAGIRFMATVRFIESDTVDVEHEREVVQMTNVIRKLEGRC